jgi:hypothetical protein
LPEAVAPARLIEAFTDAPPPLHRTALVLWQSLCLYEQAKLTSRDLDAEIADAVVGNIVRNPGRAGSLHLRGDDESPDAWTYRELTGLHALANLALRTRNRDWARRVEEVAGHHYTRTQPDYVTYQPWALFAFAWPDRTRFFVDQQLHDVQAAAGAGGTGGAEGEESSGGSGLSVMAGLLLADAADALAAFLG